MARRILCAALGISFALVVFAPHARSSGPVPQGGPPAAQPEKAQKLSREWKQLRTTHFEAATNAPTQDVARLLDQLEVYHTNLVTRLLSLRTSASLPTLVVVLKGDGTFQRFKPRNEKGRREEFVGAYFLEAPDMNYIVLPKAENGELRTVFHEYFHYVARRNSSDMPTWLSEGLAEYYSTSEFDPARGLSVIGKAIPYHIQLMRMDPLIPLDQLLSREGAGKIMRAGDPRRVAMLYAESWALVHFLVLSDSGARAGQIKVYLDAVEKGVPLEQAFRTAFGLTYQAATQQLSAYIAKNTFPFMNVTQNAAASSSASAANAMTEAEAEFVQGDLLLRLGVENEAERAIAKALALDPSYRQAKVALGQIRSRQKRDAEAIEMLGPVAEAAPNDLRAHLALGAAFLSAERYEEALREYTRAAAVNDGAASAWWGAVNAALGLGRVKESDAALDRLQQVEPGNRWYRGRAYPAFGLGDFATAAHDAQTYITKAGRGAESAPYMAFLGAISLWRLDRRAEADALLAEVRPDLAADSWPLVVMDFIQGKLAADRFLSKARDVEQQTEAHAYVGFKLLHEGRRNEALTHLRWVKERGTSAFVEHGMAVAELKRLEKIAGAV